MRPNPKLNWMSNSRRRLLSRGVVMVYTERPKGPHVISLRKAEKHESNYDCQVAKENLG
jgi:hypothetical protein